MKKVGKPLLKKRLAGKVKLERGPRSGNDRCCTKKEASAIRLV